MGRAQGEVVVELHQEMQQLVELVVGVVKIQMLQCLEVVGLGFLELEEY